MHCQLVIPGLLPPPDQKEEFLADLSLPAFTRLISRGTVHARAADHYDVWVCRQFGIAEQDHLPVAPITLTADGGQPSDAYWLRADPVHLSVNRDQLILADSKTFTITEHEAAEFTNVLNRHFGADGLIFQPLHPMRWYLRCPAEIDLRCTALNDAAGKNIDTLLPAGKDARRFRSLFNEAQMLLFTHPLNEAREKAGQLPINSVWFWGNGRMPLITRPRITGLCASDELARGLALLTEIPVSDQPTHAALRLAQTTQKGKYLVVLDELQAPRQYGDAHRWRQTLASLERYWFAPLLTALRTTPLELLAITGFGDDQSIEIRIDRSDLWKFWRRDQRLADIL